MPQWKVTFTNTARTVSYAEVAARNSRTALRLALLVWEDNNHEVKRPHEIESIMIRQVPK